MRDIDTPEQSRPFHCGTVAIVGRPNVGKSTLLNAMIGYRLSIVSQRPQTTRHRIVGIATNDAAQIVYVDTPGLHHGAKRAMNRGLNRAARYAMSDVDVLVQVIEAGRWRDEDETVYTAMGEQSGPRLLVLNKIDLEDNKSHMLPFVKEVVDNHPFDAVFYTSARRRKGLHQLEHGIIKHLPEQAPMYGQDEVTDRSERFLAAELVREQLMRRLGQELPYATAVTIDQFKNRDDGVTEIHAVIWVERKGQKAIVIGKKGEQLKVMGSQARQRMEGLFARRVYLRLWVKVREGWADNQLALRQFGYGENESD